MTRAYVRGRVKVCADCPVVISYRATRCRPCFFAQRDEVGHPATPDARVKMREAALRRYVDAVARRERAVELWRAGHTSKQIASIIGVWPDCVNKYLRQSGSRTVTG